MMSSISPILLLAVMGAARVNRDKPGPDQIFHTQRRSLRYRRRTEYPNHTRNKDLAAHDVHPFIQVS